MTWIPCGFCHNAPCTCWHTLPAQPDPVWVPLVNPAPVTFTWPLPPRLSDEDVERIAKRIVELLKDSK